MNYFQTTALIFLITFGLNGCHADLPPTSLASPAAKPTERERGTPIPATAVAPAAVSSLATLSAAAPPAAALPTSQAVAITHGNRSQAYVALTFDACQSPGPPAGFNEAIITILNETGSPATLFLGGLWMQRYPHQTQMLAANPLLELGNHSWSHPDFTRLTPSEMSQEIQRAQQIMTRHTGQKATLFRFPFDTYTDEAVAVVGRHGLRVVSGDVVSGDPDPNLSARVLVQQVTAQVEPGSIIIMHMNDRGYHTAEALPAIISQLREKGYTFVTVSQLLGLTPLPN
ncbi:MAG: polysaccharide deacetylase family protein [Anaerolineae bacterium]|nr:polysaccharide deacetylase family protein [Anaerolineae bacterium]